jgi:peptidoglycan/xylan/chitin deacetylase (PgdA/CDA1 family)
VARLLARGYRPGAAAETVGGMERVLHVTFDDAFANVLEVLPALERLDVPVTIFACSDYARDGRPLDVPELANDAAELPEELATMDWATLRAAADRGVEIGSHTRTHAHLTRLSDRELENELRESRAAIESELGGRCRFFAYPYGEEDSRVRAAVRAAGYEAAFALRSDERDVDPFALPRVALFRSDRNRLRAALKTRPVARRMIRGIRRGRRA